MGEPSETHSKLHSTKQIPTSFEKGNNADWSDTKLPKTAALHAIHCEICDQGQE